ncbi:hypothetical protein PR202_ga00192 [Eleusine coracana subsp. coracana]|uniref:Uncharacterized protein n=1 Tax=Eleusine coracana subsp. coracana TaxID=191504 RepID=A0AAV5BFH7_ELECO|nr:hypothetical protein PR202_ga00192 [Eleusine coracana subsp. coracana]
MTSSTRGRCSSRRAASRRRTYADGELDVFSAERYFKGAIDGGGVHRNKDGRGVAVVSSPLEIAAASANSRPASAGTRASAASVTSGSSANSRTTLLRRRGNGTTNKCCGVHVGALMRSCSGKRSVRVDDTGGAAKKTGVLSGSGDPAAAATGSKVDWYRELRMQKAALGVVAAAAGDRGVVAAALPPNLNSRGAAKVEDKPVELTSSRSGRGSFTLVAAPVRAHVPANENGRVGGKGNEEDEDETDDDDDGAGSESSSDLFEIKSLMIDECPYEPSEASVQWSVNTATASEHGDRVSARWITGAGAGSHRGPRGQVVAGRMNRDRQPAALLSGCVSHKAVQVSAVTRAAPNRR